MSYQLNTANILITELGDEGVAFNSATNEYFSLNETSFKILNGIKNNVSVEDIKKQLEQEYTISAAECEKAVEEAIQTFIAKKLIIEQ